MTSVNTNASAMTALRTLQQTNKALDATQNRISTGLKIGEAKDNAAYWSISTTLKSDNKSLATVKDALGLGAATVDVAYQGLNKAKEVLDEIKAKLTSATQAGVDRTAVQAEISALQAQLKSIASSSNFSGENWLAVNTAASGYSPAKTVVASFSRDNNNAVTIGTVDIDISKVALFDQNVLGGGLIDTQAELKKADGTVLTVGGASTGVAPTTVALNGVNAAVVAGTAATTGSSAVAVMGAFNLTGIHKEDTIHFTLAVDGAAAQAVSFSTDGITNQTTFLDKLNAAITSAVGAGKAVAAVDGAGKVTIASLGTGTTSDIVVAATGTLDGNGVITSALGLSSAAIAGVGTATVATVSSGSGAAFVPQVAATDAGDGLKITFSYDGAVYTTGLIASGAGSAATVIAGNIQAAMNTATGGTPITVTYNATTNKFDFSTVATGASKSLGILGTQVVNTTGVATELDFGIVPTTTAAGTSTAATYNAGTLNTALVDGGDTISFRVTQKIAGVDTAVNLNVKTEGFTGVTADDRALFVSRLQSALDASTFGTTTDRVVVGVDAVTNAITLTTTRKGDTTALSLDNIILTDGDGLTTSALGISNVDATNGTAGSAAVAASVTGSNAFTGPLTLDADDQLSFTINVNGAGAKKVTIDKALIDAHGGSNGTIANFAQLQTVVTAGLTAAGVTGVTVTESGPGTGKLKFDASTAGAGNIVLTDAVAFSGSNKMSADKIDITSANFKALTDAEKADVLSAYITVVNDAITKITSAAASLGSVAKRIDLQNTFVDTLMDTIDKGVGNLIDADLNEESTRLQALQTKQQLGVQALSIANSGTQNILRLFQ